MLMYHQSTTNHNSSSSAEFALLFFTSEMFGQMMNILDQLELVQKMSSCVCVIFSKWTFPLVSE